MSFSTEYFAVFAGEKSVLLINIIESFKRLQGYFHFPFSHKTDGNRLSAGHWVKRLDTLHVGGGALLSDSLTALSVIFPKHKMHCILHCNIHCTMQEII